MFTGIVEEVGEITGLRQSATSTVLGVRASHGSRRHEAR